MASFSFERPGFSSSLFTRIPLPPNVTPVERVRAGSRAASGISTPSSLNPSLPALSRRETPGTATAAAATGARPGEGNASGSRPALTRQPLNIEVTQDARDRAYLKLVKQMTTAKFRRWHRSLALFNSFVETQQFYLARLIPIPPKPGFHPGFNPRHRPRFPALQKAAQRRQPRNLQYFGGVVKQAARRVRSGWRRRGQSPPSPPPVDPRDVRAEQLEAPIAERFRPVGFRFRKRLGNGGQGAVYLCDMVGDGGRKIPIVVKASITGNAGRSDALKEEKEKMMTMIGAHHILQRVIVQDLPFPRRKVRQRIDPVLRIFGGKAANLPDYEEQMRRNRSDLDNSDDIIIMEYMAHGSVQDLIEKMAKEGTRMSNRALWMILNCLFKACVAMAYPLMFAEDGKDLYNEAHEQQDELVPVEAGYRNPETPIIHFDLDPLNALIGDFGPRGSAHEFVPTFKVSDLGLAELMMPPESESELTMWLWRHHGKAYIFAPEQFTEEWEYKASIDRTHLKREETAGNYNWWTNMFQVGWIMWSLITQSYPPVPPTLEHYAYGDPNLPDGNGGNYPGDPLQVEVNGLSYGGQLMLDEFAEYDPKLRSLVARLLDHNPTKRPTMQWMEQALLANGMGQHLSEQETDEQLREAMHRLFRRP